ncbi:hypothetical protein ACSHWG_00505 [Leucobacter sp. Z1108]|uniref:hypothetical protein n=1 Tax=unclassified Leucobacter TaxID=2621730 RepID=UPI003D99785B
MSGVLTVSLGANTPQILECSRAACRERATAAIHWRNPKIHGEERRKTWLACDEHLDFLRDYLTTRSFPVEVSPISGEEIVE